MNKLNNKEFKSILNEWTNYLNSSLLLEISRNEIIEVIGEDDYRTLSKLNSKASQDQNFLQVIINTYKLNQNHSIEDILSSYQNYIRFISSSWNKGEEATVDVPGGYRASLVPSTTTYEDMIKFFDAKSSMILKSKTYISCLKQGPINKDFEIILNDEDWIICYPKTIKGSISLARSFWNGRELEYDKTVSGGVGQRIGKMSWCTSIASGGNMFLNYHRRLNLHMYYCIKKNMNLEDPDRKLCISFSKKSGIAELMKGHSSVDGNNDATSEEVFKDYIGEERFNNLLEDAEKPDRLEIDVKSYYESISLEQYKILRAANEDNLENFASELEYIIKYSRDSKEIMLLAAQDKSKIDRFVIANFPDLLKSNPEGGVIIKQLATDEEVEIRKSIAKRVDLLEADPTGSIVRQLAQDEDRKVRRCMAGSDDLLEADPSGNIIKQLSQDEDSEVRSYIASREDLLEADPSGSIVRQLAQDEDSEVRSYVSYLYGTSSIQTNTNESLLRKYIKSLI